jgi:hypothetical protein
MISDVEIELSRKLLEQNHLNVPERAILGGRVRFSIVRRLIEASLAESGYFPSKLRPTDEYTGALIERRGSECWVHERYEIGVGRISPVRSRKVASLRDAILARIPEKSIDGIDLDLNA